MFLYECDAIDNDNADQWHPNVIVLSKLVYFDKNREYIKLKGRLVESLMELCQRTLYLDNITSSNGLIPPQKLLRCKYPRRIIIHPTSREKYRSWPKDKFIRLAKKLQKLGYEPSFIVHSQERSQWMDIQEDSLITLPNFSSLDELAVYIYESAWFLGNDSGIGHLASNLGLPTITLAVRPGLARTWKPYWSENVAIVPIPLIVYRRLKEKLWHYFITVNRVFKVIMKQPWIKQY
jgi:ADP-heptose:LPS heptosyltransferase